jgi:hypothetical protein
VVSLLVEALRKRDQFFRASGNAKLAPLAPFLVDDDLSHLLFPIPPPLPPLSQRGRGVEGGGIEQNVKKISVLLLVALWQRQPLFSALLH